MFDLAAIITSKTRLSVLTLFITNPSLELGVRETARKLSANPMLARHELILLQTAGLLKSRRVANSIQFSLDNSCEAISPLKQLISMGAIRAPSLAVVKNHGEAENPEKFDEVNDDE